MAIQVELGPDVEARLAVEAEAKGTTRKSTRAVS
jgi:hypothetical protein